MSVSTESERIRVNWVQMEKEDFRLTHLHAHRNKKHINTVFFIRFLPLRPLSFQAIFWFYSTVFFPFALDNSWWKEPLRQIKRDSLFVCAFSLCLGFDHYNCNKNGWFVATILLYSQKKKRSTANIKRISTKFSGNGIYLAFLFFFQKQTTNSHIQIIIDRYWRGNLPVIFSATSRRQPKHNHL